MSLSDINKGLSGVNPTSGSGDVVGPASSTDNAVARFDLATGKLIQNSGVIIDDSNNLFANNASSAYASTATSGGTTTLTVASAAIQEFTGTSTHTVVMEVTSTLTQGFTQTIINSSTKPLTVNSSGGNLIIVLASNTRADIMCILTSGTTAASWSYKYEFANGTNSGNAIFRTTALGGPLLFPDGLYRYEQTLSSADIKGMYDTPVLVLAAPPANLYHQMSPFSYSFLTFGTTAYTLGGTHFLQSSNGVHGSGLQVLTSWTAASNSLWSTTNLARRGMLSATTSANPTSLSAIGAYASNSTAAFATGDSTLTYRLAYSLLSAV